MDNVGNLDKKCRVCGIDILDLTCGIPIFGHNEKGVCLDQKIQKYLYVIVRPDDELPKLICATCFIKIESIDKFSFAARKTEESFLAWLRKSKLANDEDYLTQTIVETSTNSDFSFNNITIKKEIKQNEQQHKIVYKTFRNPRNPRYVDHITLEQIINDQIIKNPKISPTTIIVEDRPPKKKKRPTQEEEDVSVLNSNYPNVLLGQMIKDQELLKLMLKALKWAEYDKNSSYEELLDRLKQTNSREILTNKNLLNDNDVMLLLKSYVGNNTNLYNVQQIPYKNIVNLFPTQQPQTAPVQAKPQNPAPVEKPKTINRPRMKYVGRNLNLVNEHVTNMEVGLDPSLFMYSKKEAGGSNPRIKSTQDIVIDESRDKVQEANLQISKVETLSKTDLNKNTLSKVPVKVVKMLEPSQNKVQAFKIVKNDKGSNAQSSIKIVEKPKILDEAMKTYSRKDRAEIKVAQEPKKITNEIQVDLTIDESKSKAPEIKEEPIEPETIIEDPKGKIKKSSETEKKRESEEKTGTSMKESSKSKENVPENKNPSKNEAQQPSDIRNNGKYVCSSCPEIFLTNTDLQNHVTSHLIAKQSKAQESSKVEEKQQESNEEKEKEDEIEEEKENEKEMEIESEIEEEKEEEEEEKEEDAQKHNEKDKDKKKEKEKRIEKEKSKEKDEKEDEKEKPEKSIEKEPVRSKRLEEKRLRKEVSTTKRKILPIRIKFKSQSEIKRVQRKACPVCNKRIPNENMKAHLLAHNKCNKCGRLFKKHENFLRHKASNCKDQKMYQCAGCTKEFTNSRNRNLHQSKNHPELKAGPDSERQ